MKSAVSVYTTDISKRTKTAKRAYHMFVACAIALLLSVTGFAAGSARYGQIVAQSSTAIGTSLPFKRSGASTYLSGLYTDNKQNVLIARISFSKPADSVVLPYRGSDYKVFVQSGSIPKDVNEISCLMGRLSSDGDMFFVLPRPNPDTVYSVFIMNTNYLGNLGNASSGKTGAEKIDWDAETKSLTAAMSEYNPETAVTDIDKSAYAVQNDTQDVIGFRLTLNPSLKDAAHTPRVIDAELLNSNNMFDFEAFFDKVFIESARKELTVKFEELNSQTKQLEKQADEMSDRLSKNINDKAASDRLTKISSELDSANEKKRQTVDQLSAYENLVFDDSLFSDLSTSARVIHK